MNAWIQTLKPAIQRHLDPNVDWRVIAPARRGGWVACAAHGGETEPLSWYQLPEPLDSGDDMRVTLLDPLNDSRLESIQTWVSDGLRHGGSIQLLAYKPGRRAVLREESRDGVRVRKVFDRDREVWQRWQTCCGGSASTSTEHTSTAHVSEAQLETPRLESWNPERRTLTTGLVAGFSLNELWRRNRGSAVHGEVLRNLLKALRSRDIPADFPEHTPKDEQRAIQNQWELYQELIAQPHPTVERSAKEALEALARLEGSEADATCLSHRDFHDKQVFLSPAKPALIDFDLSAMAAPALDEGNMLAHLELRGLQLRAKDIAFPWQGIASEFVRESECRTSLHVWTASALARLALLYGRRQRPDGLELELAESALAAMARAGVWTDLL